MSTMKAWQYSNLDGKLEDALQLNNAVPIPDRNSLTKGQLLVQVISASLNPVDYKYPETAIIGRLTIPRPATPGIDFCGRVIAKHTSNAAFEEGQLVFGGFPGSVIHKGTLAEYVVIPGGCCAALPEGVDPDDAAAVGTAATTAYQSLMPESLSPGSKIFVNGGSGGVGTWTIQLARALGAEVVTSCSTSNVELCRQLGAHEVIDYRTVDLIANLTERGQVFDLVIDNVGGNNELYNIRNSILKPGSTFVQVGIAMSLQNILAMFKKQLWPVSAGNSKFYFVNMKNSTEFFDRVGGWMKDGTVKAVIDTKYPLEDVPKAYKQLREGHTKGKIIVRISN